MQICFDFFLDGSCLGRKIIGKFVIMKSRDNRVWTSLRVKSVKAFVSYVNYYQNVTLVKENQVYRMALSSTSRLLPVHTSGCPMGHEHISIL